MASNAVTSINSDSLFEELKSYPLAPPSDLTPIIEAPQAKNIEFDKAGDGRHVN